MRMRRFIINVFLLLSFLLAGINPLSAEEAMKSITNVTQFNLLPNLYNPAFTGSNEFFRIRLAGRLQTVGLENYPKNFLVTADSPFQLGKSSFGAGITLSKLNYHNCSNFLISAQGSYHFKVGKGFLSPGLNLGYFHSRFESQWTPEIPEPGENDEEDTEGTLSSNINEKVKGDRFDVGLGLAYFTENFRIGASLLHLNSPRIRDRKLSSTLYFESGGNIELKPTLLSLQPSLLVTTDFSSFHGEISLGSTIKNFLNIGVAYRLREAVGIMAGINYKNFVLGYAYDIPAGRLSKGSKGSHELVLGYRFPLDISKKSPYSQKSIRLM